MKAKIIFLRSLAIVGIFGVIGIVLYRYLETGMLLDIPKAVIVLLSFLFLLVGTFVGSIDNGKKVNLKAEFEKEAQCLSLIHI